MFAWNFGSYQLIFSMFMVFLLLMFEMMAPFVTVLTAGTAY